MWHGLRLPVPASESSHQASRSQVRVQIPHVTVQRCGIIGTTRWAACGVRGGASQLPAAEAWVAPSSAGLTIPAGSWELRCSSSLCEQRAKRRPCGETQRSHRGEAETVEPRGARGGRIPSRKLLLLRGAGNATETGKIMGASETRKGIAQGCGLPGRRGRAAQHTAVFSVPPRTAPPEVRAPRGLREDVSGRGAERGLLGVPGVARCVSWTQIFKNL